MRRAWRAARLSRLLVALAIMLIAVLPHATLAASTLHMAAAPPGHATGPHHGPPVDAPAVPCHEAAEPDHQPGPAMPACCIVGCGLLAAAPAVSVLSSAAIWRSALLATAQPGEGAMIEPAERPPRRQRVRI